MPHHVRKNKPKSKTNDTKQLSMNNERISNYHEFANVCKLTQTVPDKNKPK